MALILPRASDTFRKSTFTFRTISNSQKVLQNSPLCSIRSEILKPSKISHLTSSTNFQNSPSFILRSLSNSQIKHKQKYKDPEKNQKQNVKHGFNSEYWSQQDFNDSFLKMDEVKEKKWQFILKLTKYICFSMLIIGGLIYWINQFMLYKWPNGTRPGDKYVD